MSKLFRKNKSKLITNNRVYSILTSINPDRYCDEGWYVYKGLYKYQVRQYRTWKYNRKTQYKL